MVTKTLWVSLFGGLLSFSALAQDAATASTNPAVVPASKLENDFYNWEERHAAILKIKMEVNPEIVMMGDSITHLWGGLPEEKKGGRGKEAWAKLFGERRVLNCGFGWDRTQNALWRIDHGELDGISPQYIVVNIGTNNLANTKNCRACTPEEIAEGIAAVAKRCRAKCPSAEIIVMGVFPRGKLPTDPNRAKVAAINLAAVKALGGIPHGVVFLDIGAQFLEPDGTISPKIMPDALHPSNDGYTIWAEQLKPLLEKAKSANLPTGEVNSSPQKSGAK